MGSQAFSSAYAIVLNSLERPKFTCRFAPGLFSRNPAGSQLTLRRADLREHRCGGFWRCLTFTDLSLTSTMLSRCNFRPFEEANSRVTWDLRRHSSCRPSSSSFGFALEPRFPHEARLAALRLPSSGADSADYFDAGIERVDAITLPSLQGPFG